MRRLQHEEWACGSDCELVPYVQHLVFIELMNSSKLCVFHIEALFWETDQWKSEM